ncbi:hemagglutinin repeat-containing protein [Martelella alba]|uniref:Filamentous hemagglutinin N-terminal domain-containing protein n=1 Tax=Martelella alba TaxID=2590451 RepID=A0ABY2SHN0_9HYPH|nr:hemagglutinin repeat-containing protein [Martelella alba]TKI04145.1 filamentous hemagglutinin N-terminal domain-containing protein [Martelella alba]
MNKHRYRVIFNNARGMPMAVSDIAGAGRRVGPIRGTPEPLSAAGPKWRLTALRFALLLAGGVAFRAHAGFDADPAAPGDHQPAITHTANGIAQIDIQAHNEHGLSHNTYRQFDVEPAGVILNNSVQAASTQLAGYVDGNPWLAGSGEASMILNEVNSPHASHLDGWIEVAGRGAEVIIANPAGISCDGCGFINAHNATLAAGQALVQDGRLSGFDVERGEIIFAGAANLNSDHATLIARAVRVNADVHARRLTIVTGRNITDRHGAILEKKPDDGASPEYALDVAALGGMYAHKIHMKGNEHGLGVRNAGRIGAMAGELTLTAEGRLENLGDMLSLAKMELTVDGEMRNTGRMASHDNMHLTVKGEHGRLLNDGHVAAKGDILAAAAGVRSGGQSRWQAGLDGRRRGVRSSALRMAAHGDIRLQGENDAGGEISLSGATLDLSGGRTTSPVLVLDAGGALSLRGAQVCADRLIVHAPAGVDNDEGRLSAGAMTIKTSRLSNRRGSLRQTGTGPLALRVHDALDRHDATASCVERNHRRRPAPSQGVIDNTGGVIDSGAALDINTGRMVNNDGRMQARGDIVAMTYHIDNSDGQMLTDGDGKVIAVCLDNRAGLLQAGGRVDCHAPAVNNAGGRIIGAGDVALNSTRHLNNAGGLIDASGPLRVSAGIVDNSGGRILAAGQTVVDTRLLHNPQGKIHVQGSDFHCQSGALDNRGGDIQTVGHAQWLFRRKAGASADDALAEFNGSSPEAGHVDNTSGLIHIGGHLALDAGELANRQGRIIAAGDRAELILTGLTGEGQVISLGRLAVTLRGALHHTGEMRAKDGLTLSATGPLTNMGLLSAGQALALSAHALDNDAGARIRAGEWRAALPGALRNCGQIRADAVRIVAQSLENAGTATLQTDATQLTLSGELVNQGHLSLGNTRLDAAAWANAAGAEIHTARLRVRLPGAFCNNGTLHAHDGQIEAASLANAAGARFQARTLQVALSGSFDNQGALRLGEADVNAATFHNAPAAALEAETLRLSLDGPLENHGTLRLTLRGQLHNRGLIDADQGRLEAATLLNTATGRLYGDHLALRADRLDNHAQEGCAPVIAARQRLDIGAGRLDNRDGGLIASEGHLALGGGLDAQGHAVGRVGGVNNHDAVIDAGGDLVIDADDIANTNGGLTLTKTTRHERRHEGVLNGQTTRYAWRDINTRRKDKYGVRDAIMPDGSASQKFYEYRYTRLITEDAIDKSRPGRILAGGTMTLNARRLLNHDSQIVAGGELLGHIGDLRNETTQGQRVIKDRGYQWHWYDKKKKNRLGKTKTSQGKDRTVYRPLPVSETLSLQTMVWRHNAGDENQTAAATSRVPFGRRAKPAPSSLAPLQPPATEEQRKQWRQLPLALWAGQVYAHPIPAMDIPGHAWTSRVKTMAIETAPPHSSLFKLHPRPAIGYLVETCPRYTRYKQWIGLDYMQDKLPFTPSVAHKRLGDGYYEQRLVREQMMQLTGRHLLEGHRNESDQFKALMNAGLRHAEAFHLTPGVMLSPHQMALLTSDMVWLVNREVALPDGGTQQVLVPQLYVRARDGDLTGDGALLSGRDIRLTVDGQLANSGAAKAEGQLVLGAGAITSSGSLAAREIRLSAQRDIKQTGGAIAAEDNITLTAGRDIRVQSTVRGDGENQWRDRNAGIYVHNKDGELSLAALNDIDLTAVTIANGGGQSRTVLAAGRDINLGTLSTVKREKAYWDADNYRLSDQQREEGSHIGGGVVALSAGRDINARAAAIESEGHLDLQAGRNIALSAGRTESHVIEHGKQTSRGWVSAISLETHDEVHAYQAQGPLLGGDTLRLSAGRDLMAEGGAIAGVGDIELTAGNRLTLTTALERHHVSHSRQEKNSGLMGSGGIGASLGKESLKTDDQLTLQQHRGTLAGSEQGSVRLRAGDTLVVHGSDVVAGGEIALSGAEVSLSAAENSVIEQHAREYKRSGLTLKFSDVLGNAVKNSVKNLQQTGKTDNGRLSGLYRVKDAYQGAKAEAARSLATWQSVAPHNNPIPGMSLTYDSQKSRTLQHHERYQAQGSTLAGGGNIAITATGRQNGHISLHGANVRTDRDMTLQAVRDIRLFSALNREIIKNGAASVTGKNLMSFSAEQSCDEVYSTRAMGSRLTGDSIRLSAGRDILAKGGVIAGTQDVLLSAGRQLTLTAVEEIHRESHSRQAQKSGLMDSGVIDISLGNESQQRDDSLYVRRHAGVMAGSERGLTRLEAGDRINIAGSDIVAGGDLHVIGAEIDVSSVENHIVEKQESAYKRSGLTLALSGTVGGAINNLAQNIQQAESDDNPRLATLQRIKAVLSGVQAVGAGALSAAQGDSPQNTNAIGASLSLGSQSSHADQRCEQYQSQGSTLSSGGNLTMAAAGGRNGAGDIAIQAGELRAGGDIRLNARRDIQLISALNREKLEGSNSSRSGVVGVGIGVGQGGFGFSIFAGINKGEGGELGEGAFHADSLLTAGRQVALTSGRDALLAGAQVSGETVTADIGRNLLMQSRQDSDDYDAKQLNISASGQFTFGSMTGSGSVSVNRSRQNSRYSAVREQTGLFAGRGGVDVQVAGHTQLDGAAIASNAMAKRNRLKTGTLGFIDICNQTRYHVEQQSVGMSSGGPVGEQFMGNLTGGLLAGVNRSGGRSNMTQAVFSPGDLLISQPQDPRQSIAGLSRDVARAHKTLDPLFDKTQERQRLQQVSLVAEIGAQVIDIASTAAAVSATKSAHQVAANAGERERTAARETLRREKGLNETPTNADIQQRIWDNAYNQAYAATGMGVGGSHARALTALNGFAQGLAGGNIGQALAGAASPYVA